MSSDIMIICQEFNNFYGHRDLDDKYEKLADAVCIGEASMGDPGEENQFANWFISRFYSGQTMLESVTMAGRLTKQDEREMMFQHEVFTESDYVACLHALSNMTHPYLDEQDRIPDLIKYLDTCIGNHVSTENW